MMILYISSYSAIPCHLEQMLPSLGYNIRFLRPLIEIVQTLEVHEIFLLECSLREGNGNMFASDPLIKIAFNLDLEFISNEEEIKVWTYNCQDKGDY